MEKKHSDIIQECRNEIQLLDNKTKKTVLQEIFSSIDNTTLNGCDSELSVEDFCKTTLSYIIPSLDRGIHVSSICVYPRFVSLVKKKIRGSGIGVASVAGGFPAGQTPLAVKLAEIKYAVDQGSDEIDFVINRGDFLLKKYNAVANEVSEAKKVCGSDVKLKVIIETGELQTPDNIYKASMISLESGADFIKTSTGKIPVGATPEAVYYMLSAMKEFKKNTKKQVGFKAAGGISDISDAMLYYFMTKKILNLNIVSNQDFRIGTSRLTGQMFKYLTNQ